MEVNKKSKEEQKAEKEAKEKERNKDPIMHALMKDVYE